jgi:FkbM family methyltransferase
MASAGPRGSGVIARNSDVVASGDVQVIGTDVLKKFQPWSGTVPAGYFAYFLGNLARADYWKFSDELRAIYDRERFESFTGPRIDDNIFDWLVLLEAVVEAKDEFTMAALGAGWGRWLVAASMAVEQYSNIPVHLIGVEAEPTHFAWMIEHFRDNGLEARDHDLIEAAAAGERGQAWFYIGRADAWYGQSIVRDASLNEPASGGDAEVNGEKVRVVRAIDLTELLWRYGRIDYLHMDIQGAELEFLSSAPALLNRRVKRVLVGTHSGEIEAGLRRLFDALGWRCQHDVAMNKPVRVEDTIIELGDGVQVWINPSL